MDAMLLAAIFFGTSAGVALTFLLDLVEERLESKE